MTGTGTQIETERLLLRQWRDEDVPELAAIYAEPEVVRYLVPLDLDGTRTQVERFRRAWAEDGTGHFAAVEKATGRLLGRIGVMRHHDWPVEPDPYEVGWTLRRDAWGRGYATEGGGAALDWAFARFAPGHVISIADPRNERSTNVMRRLGFTRRGSARWRDFDVDWYAIERDTWAARRG